MMLIVYIDDKTKERLEDAARQLGQSVEMLAENAIAEAALDWEKQRPAQPK